MSNGFDISRIVRIGTVMTVDRGKHLARVIFRDKSEQSGWLRVVDSRSFISEDDDSSPFKQWMPKVNDAVVCLYMPKDDADGFILGAVNT